MTLKMKLSSTICAFLLILGLTIMGVMAAPSATVNLGGSISFTATDVNAKVTGDISGATNNPEELPELLFSAGLDDAALAELNADKAKWGECDLEFASTGKDLSILVTIENLAERPLYATIVANANMTADVTSTMESLTAADAESGTPYTGDTITIPAKSGETTYFAYVRLSLEVNNKNASLGNDATWGYDIVLDNEEPEESSSVTMHYDEENNYYYIEMGTYGGNPVRWRYVSDVTSGIDTATRFAPTAENKPNTSSGSQGMFILESDIFGLEDLYDNDTNDGALNYLDDELYDESTLKHTTEGFTDLNGTEYASSDLRAFLNGTSNVAGNSVGNIMSVINIDSSNPIYLKIKKRSLSDLYSGIGVSNETSYTALSANVPMQYNATKDDLTDAFWVLSANEAYRILGGNTIRQNELIWKSKVYVDMMEKEGAPEQYQCASYWFRSPTSYHGVYCFDHSSDEGLTGASLTGYSVAVRPSFVLEF